MEYSRSGTPSDEARLPAGPRCEQMAVRDRPSNTQSCERSSPPGSAKDYPRQSRLPARLPKQIALHYLGRGRVHLLRATCMRAAQLPTSDSTCSVVVAVSRSDDLSCVEHGPRRIIALACEQAVRMAIVLTSVGVVQAWV